MVRVRFRVWVRVRPFSRSREVRFWTRPKCFMVLTRDPRDPFTFVDQFDPLPADPLSALS